MTLMKLSDTCGATAASSSPCRTLCNRVDTDDSKLLSVSLAVAVVDDDDAGTYGTHDPVSASKERSNAC